MARSIVDSGGYVIDINGQEVELRKLTLGHLETLEREYGSLDKALGSMKGIIHAIYLAAKRGGFEGKQSDVADAIEFDQIHGIVGAIANQASLTLTPEESKIIGDLVAAALLADENEDAVASIESIAKNTNPFLSVLRIALSPLRELWGKLRGPTGRSRLRPASCM